MINIKNLTRYILFIDAIIVFGIVILGCGGELSQKSDDDKTIARINNYKLTVKDLKSEAIDSTISKEDLLENMIVKKILLQEAERQNLDKDKVFMKEIERYWEQALLKLLINKKIKELYSKVTAPDAEARSEKTQEALEKWIKDLRAGASVKIDNNVLNEVKIDKNQ
ncbi:MAG: hypothetical protein JW994_02885 [Candidatus Omnitrophica bacterium]|nr:hypothetical protein [Candidatus Omnitrophota bacterium]